MLRALGHEGVDEVASLGDEHDVQAYVPRVLRAALQRRGVGTVGEQWLERIEGTLVVLDVSGFTALTERLARAGDEGAEWLSDVLTGFFAPLLEQCCSAGGDVIVFGGDAMLVLYAGARHRARALRSTFGLLEHVRTAPPVRYAGRRVRVEASAGAHAGTFWLVPIDAAADARSFLLFGEDAEQVAGAEAAAGPGELLVTPAILKGLEREVGCEQRGAFWRVASVAPAGPPPGPRVSPDTVPLELLMPFVSLPVRRHHADEHPRARHEGDHRDACIVFVSLPGASDLAAGGDLPSTARALGLFASALARAAADLGGYLVSTDISPDGPKLLFAFGAPVAHEHDAANALRYALAAQHIAADTHGGSPVRVGIACGHVFAGDIGTDWRRQYTVFGDPVNLAARLMGAAEPGQTLVAARATERARRERGTFETVEVGPLRLKGKREPQPTVALEGDREPESSVAKQTAAFVGRECELHLIEDALRTAAGGQACTVLIEGDPGVGKSRLVEQAIRGAGAAGWAVHRGVCFGHTSGRPFWALRPLVKSLLGLPATGPGETCTSLLEERIGALTPDRAEAAPLLNPILGTRLPETSLTSALDTASARNLLFGLLTALVDASARNCPQLLFIDDIHWADPSTAELVERLAAATLPAPVLVLLTSRLTGRRLALPEASTVRLRLDELSDDAARELVEHLLRAERMRADLPRLLSTTHGNPLYITQVVDAMRTSSDVTLQVKDTGVPQQLRGLLANRIDTLNAESAELLRVASCVGERFAPSTLAQLGIEGGGRLEPTLENLVHVGLLAEERNGEIVYHFSHGLVRQAAYEGMRFSRRRELQEHVGLWVEQRHADRLEEVYEDLAYHFSESARKDLARKYAILAAETAAASYAHQEAVGFYQMAIEATRARTSAAARWRAEVLERIGDAYVSMMLTEEGKRFYRSALRTWRRANVAQANAADHGFPEIQSKWPRSAEVAVLATKISESWSKRLADGTTWALRAYDWAPPEDMAVRAEACRILGATLSLTSHPQEARAWGRRALSYARRSGDERVLCNSYFSLANACMRMGYNRQSIEALGDAILVYLASGGATERGEPERTQSAVSIAQTAGPVLHGSREGLRRVLEDERVYEAALWAGGPGRLMGTRANASYLQNSMGEFDLAERAILDAMTLIARHGGTPDAIDFWKCNLGASELMQGRYDEAAAHLDESMEACARMGGNAGVTSSCLLDLCRRDILLGDFDTARAHLDQARSSVGESGWAERSHTYVLLDAQIRLLTGDASTAGRLAEKVLLRTRQTGVKVYQAEALRIMALAREARGDLKQAGTLLRESIAHAARMPAYYDHALGKVEFARVGLEVGTHDRRRAMRLLHEAEQSLRLSGALPDAERAATKRMSLAR